MKTEKCKTEAQRRTQDCGFVRAARETDIPALVALHDSVVGRQEARDVDTKAQHFRKIFFEHPWINDAYPSFVHEDHDGKIRGCIGVVPRPYLYKGQSIIVAVSHNFVVDPGFRNKMVALLLAQKFLAGPQALSLAEGNNLSRKIWESFGGSCSLQYSLSWTQPLRPGAYALRFLRNRGVHQSFVFPFIPFAWGLDSILGRLLSLDRRFPEPELTSEPLDTDTLIACMSDVAKGSILRPELDAQGAVWLFAALERNRQKCLMKRCLLDRAGRKVGWYIYSFDQHTKSVDVIQMGGMPGSESKVLRYLLREAHVRGAIVVSGQLSPVFFAALARLRCAFHNDGKSWVLVHAKKKSLIEEINAGAALISRLEGEWWINHINT